jgi:TetR/AcrR family transcriptional regulator
VFAESGFAGASVRDIASRAGLNAASLYNYYPGKQELYEAVLDRSLFPILEMLGGLADTAAADDASLDVVDVVVDHIARRPAIARILHYEALAGGESIAHLVGRWIAPIYSSGVEALRRSEAAEVWTADELPLLIESLHNVIVGYFSMAPLLERIVGDDPLSEQALARKKVFLKKFVARLVRNPR